jgi:hypothetical protein
METIVRELIRDSIKHYDCLEDLLWEFTEKINQESMADLLQVITFDAILDYLDSKNIYYKGSSVYDVANLYMLVLAKEILLQDFPKVYSEVKE